MSLQQAVHSTSTCSYTAVSTTTFKNSYYTTSSITDCTANSPSNCRSTAPRSYACGKKIGRTVVSSHSAPIAKCESEPQPCICLITCDRHACNCARLHQHSVHGCERHWRRIKRSSRPKLVPVRYVPIQSWYFTTTTP